MKRRACILAVMAAVGMLCSACRSPRGDAESAYLPLSEIQPEFGTLIATGNQPTRDQGGTGDRIGLFRDSAGFVWGLPISVSGDGTVRACAPMTLRGRNVTDDLPAGATIVGSTNAPTGWQGGTGVLELVFRDAGGSIRSRKLHGGALDGKAKCGSRPLHYYRLATIAARP
jgi:hypothetical protein